MNGLSRPGADEEPPLAGSVHVPAMQMPEHTRGRHEAHVEAATTGFVSQGLREVRFPDMRWTLNRPTVELTDLMLICRRAIWGLAGDGGPADGHTRRHSVQAGSEQSRYAVGSDADRRVAALQGVTQAGCVSGADCRSEPRRPGN